MPDWNKPLPTIAGETKPFWDACRRGTLLIQQCGQCYQYQFYPRGICSNCWCGDINWVTASGKGTVWTFTVTRQNARFRPGGPLRAGVGGVGGGRQDVYQHRGMRPLRRENRTAGGGHFRAGHRPDFSALFPAAKLTPIPESSVVPKPAFYRGRVGGLSRFESCGAVR